MRFLPSRWQLSATTLALVLALFFTALNYGFFRTVWQAWREAGGDGTFLWSVPLFLFLCLNVVFHLLLLPFLHKIIIPLVLLLSRRSVIPSSSSASISTAPCSPTC